jgi:hypothetical protein
MSWENSEKFGTKNFSEKQAYEMMKGINKMMWEGKENSQEVEVKKEEPKKTGFC